MRVVSLAPSATNIVERLGLGSYLVATTSHDETRPSIGGWLTPDIEAVSSFEPDYILASDALQDRIVDSIEEEFTVLYHQPTTLSDVESSIREIGTVIGSRSVGDAGAALFRDGLRNQSYAPKTRPTIYCEEWMNPPMAGGNWVPEIVRLAGGRYPFKQAGERSGEIGKKEFEENEPAIAICHICGRGVDVTPQFEERGWNAPAVRQNRVHVIDDDSLNQPSYALLRGLQEIRSLVRNWEQETNPEAQ